MRTLKCALLLIKRNVMIKVSLKSAALLKSLFPRNELFRRLTEVASKVSCKV